MATSKDSKARQTGSEGQHPRGPEGQHPRAAGDDDVEGHSMLPNMGFNRGVAQGREHEIQAKLRQRQLETEAKRPHQKGR